MLLSSCSFLFFSGCQQTLNMPHYAHKLTNSPVKAAFTPNPILKFSVRQHIWWRLSLKTHLIRICASSRCIPCSLHELHVPFWWNAANYGIMLTPSHIIVKPQSELPRQLFVCRIQFIYFWGRCPSINLNTKKNTVQSGCYYSTVCAFHSG